METTPDPDAILRDLARGFPCEDYQGCLRPSHCEHKRKCVWPAFTRTERGRRYRARQMEYETERERETDTMDSQEPVTEN